jgi:hypothetical protein
MAIDQKSVERALGGITARRFAGAVGVYIINCCEK